jgi:integrase/recombinase XerD
VRPPAKRKLLPHALSVDDVVRLLEAASMGEGPVPLRDRALLELLYATGGRISEVVGLDVDALGWLGEEGSAAFVRLHGKGDKERVVPVGSYARDCLDTYLVRARPDLAAHGVGNSALFLNALGRRLSRQSAWAILQEAAGRAGLVHVSPHTQRHSFATHLLQGGADVRVVQELLGHASVTTTQIYTLVTPETLREVYAASHPRAR